jgi:alkylation response protein AidB-like acyl-CoA dehydrogenase
MDFELSEEEKAIKEEIHEFLEKKLRPLVKQIDKKVCRGISCLRPEKWVYGACQRKERYESFSYKRSFSFYYFFNLYLCIL